MTIAVHGLRKNKKNSPVLLALIFFLSKDYVFA